MPLALGLGLGLSFGGLAFSKAALLAGAELSALSASFADNSLYIKDPVTPANNYNGPLITAGAFNKFTYSRASTATFVGSNGLIQTAATNTPRIEYDPVTLKVKGYLHEGARTNLAFQSEAFDNATWSKANSTVVANNQIAPDGNTTADTLTEDTTNNVHYTIQSSITLTNTPCTMSCWMKPGTQRYGILSVIDGGSTERIAVFDLQAGTVGFTSAATTATTTAYPNGWYRCTMTMTPAAGATCYCVVYITDTSAAYHAYLGTSKTIYLWGAQVEQAGAASSYIPTTTAAVTRAADFAPALISLFNAPLGVGSLYVKNTWQGGNAVSPGSRIAASINDNTTSNRAFLYNGGTGISGYASSANAVDGGANVADGVFTKLALAYANNDYAFIQDSIVRGTVASGGAVGAVNQLLVGADPVNNNGPLFGTIQEFMFVGRRMTNAQLQALTT